MKIGQFLLGLLIGFVVTLIGGCLYVELVTSFSFFKDMSFLIKSDLGGKVIAIGSLLNIAVVYLLLNKSYYDVVKGVLTALILLVVISQII
ncbi:hypothetical protein QW060_01415 [Myroides ceti]|uniref:Uncharacterized protein n=1 Tax=Paenimyroides ceti TaxID=395087 RepID=A0ABT8CPA4_9FLAO|nr:hypothetical protein [Paenimyroides ceti]MDN3705781.1 hypothetical protein [Paenimyroides ceti]